MSQKPKDLIELHENIGDTIRAMKAAVVWGASDYEAQLEIDRLEARQADIHRLLTITPDRPRR